MIFANFYKRIIAFLIDVVIIYLSIKAIFLVLHKSLDLMIWMLLSGVLSIFYFVFFWIKLNGQTPGAYLMKIRVVAIDNRPISFKKAFLRASSLFVFICPYGVLIPLIGTGLGDISNGLVGGESVTLTLIKTYLNTPNEVTAVNPFN